MLRKYQVIFSLLLTYISCLVDSLLLMNCNSTSSLSYQTIRDETDGSLFTHWALLRRLNIASATVDEDEMSKDDHISHTVTGEVFLRGSLRFSL